jgi:hypothetical protein
VQQALTISGQLRRLVGLATMEFEARLTTTQSHVRNNSSSRGYNRRVASLKAWFDGWSDTCLRPVVNPAKTHTPAQDSCCRASRLFIMTRGAAPVINEQVPAITETSQVPLSLRECSPDHQSCWEAHRAAGSGYT